MILIYNNESSLYYSIINTRFNITCIVEYFREDIFEKYILCEK